MRILEGVAHRESYIVYVKVGSENNDAECQSEAGGIVTSANDAGSSWGTDTQGREHLSHYTVNTLDFDL